MDDAADAPRLFLITPPRVEAESFTPRLEEALVGGDVAAVLIAGDRDGALSQAVVERFVPIIQAAGAAALIADDTRFAGHVKADGVHVESGLDDLRLALKSFRPKRIVGAGHLTSRHAAMEVGELEPDYLFFGRPQGDTHDAPHPKVLQLAEWWSELMEIPAVAMAGRSLDGVAEAAATGAAFVAVHDAIWQHAGGPGEAVAAAEAALRRSGRQAA